MIIGWLRLLAVALVGLTIVYVLVSIYSRSVRREKLEKEWDTDPAREGAPAGEREAFIEDGMEHYRHGLKRRLLWLIYIIPMIVFVVIIYVVNW
jgi:Ca2+/Na+ antiporter